MSRSSFPLVRPALAAACLGVPVLSVFVAASEARELDVLVVTGDVPSGPDDTPISQLSAPTLNNNGEVGFAGTWSVQGPGGGTSAGGYRPGEGLLRLVDGPSAAPALNNAGTFSLIGTAVPPGGSTATLALLHVLPDGSVVPQAYAGQPVPEGNGALLGFASFYVGLTDGGHTPFSAANDNDTADPFDNDGLYRASGGSFATIARGGSEVPGIPGSTIYQFFTVGSPTPDANDAGLVAFRVYFDDPADPGTFPVALAVGNGVSTQLLVRTGDAAPDGNGFFPDGGQGAEDGNFARRPVLNNAGQVAFFSYLDGTSGGAADDDGVFLADSSGVTQIARAGQSLPKGGVLGGFDAEDGPFLSLNDAGQIAFMAPVGGGNGVFRGEAGSLTEVARAGDVLDDGGVIGFIEDSGVPLNEQGQVAFFAGVDNGDGTGGERLFLYDDEDGLITVARVGDELLGSTIVDLRFNEFAQNTVEHYGLDGRSPLNDLGQIAFIADLEDGRDVLMLYSVPEPAAAATMAVAGLLALRRRRA